MDNLKAIDYGKKLADSFIKERGLLSDQWEHEHGILLKGIWDLWSFSEEEKYFEYLEGSISPLIDEEGNIEGYKLEDYFLDNIVSGRVLFPLYKNTGNEKYKKAICKLKDQFTTHPKTSFGNFLHKGFQKEILQIDSIYMGMPFYAQFEKEFGDGDYEIVANSIINAYKFNYNKETGLMYHGYDGSKEQKWANSVTGNSSTFWGRGMGWLLGGILDVLDYLPSNSDNYKKLIEIYRDIMISLLKYQDDKGVWYQVIDKEGEKDNYKETSASAMFTYCLAKGINKAYLDKKYEEETKKAYKGLINEFIVKRSENDYKLVGTCASAGLGVKEYRDGSYESYVNEPTKDNDLKGVGVFLMASVEVEKLIKK